MRPLHPAWYLALASVLCLWFAEAGRALTGRYTPPLDDAFIHFQYATQFAAGEPFQYQSGDACTSGATSFLWPILLAPAAALGAHDGGMYLYALLLGALALGGAATFTSRWVARWSDPATAGWAGLLVVGCGPLVWGAASGMEVAVFACALAAVLNLLGRAPGNALFAWATVLATVRPEGALVAGGLLAPTALAAFRARAPLHILRAGLPAILGVGLPLALALHCSGSFLPTSVLAKRNPRFPSTEEISRLWYFVDDLVLGGLGEHFFGRAGLLVLGLAGVGLVRLLVVDIGPPRGPPRGGARLSGEGARALLALLLPLGLVAMSVPHGTHHYRYVMPLLPVVLGLVAWGGAAVEGALHRAGGPAGPWVRGATAALVLGAGLPGWAVAFAQNTRDIALQQVSLAEWVAAHTPPDARFVINDAGAMGYLAGRRVIDLEGIVSDGTIREAMAGEGSLLSLLRREKPDYAVIFPRWFEGAWAAGLFQTVAKADLPVRTISGAEIMVVATLDRTLLKNTPPTLSPGERVIDTLDVSDLDHEAAHGWRADGAALQLARDNDIVVGGGAGGARVVDGARRLFGRESFTLDGGSAPSTLVVRLGPTSVESGFVLSVNGQALGPVTLPRVADGGWREVGWPMPPGRLEITLEPTDGLAGDAGGRLVGAWWLVGRGE